MADYRIIHMPNVIDPRGNLTYAEFGNQIPFDVKRYFMVYQVPLVAMRGEHAHKECHELLVCARGSVYVACDDGNEKEDFILSHPTMGLYIPPKVWATQYNYSPDALLLVFNSHYYENADYIRDYTEFQSFVGLQS